MIRRNALAFFVLTAVSAVAHAAPQCAQRVVAPGDVLSIAASPTEAVHITLPEPIIKDLVAVPALWDAHFDPAAPMHYWVRAKSVDAALGATSTLTLITASGTAYDFRLERVAKADITCFTVDDSVSMASSVVPMPPPTAAEPVAIFTRYVWAGNAIDSVHDDGRYTYVRLTDAPEGAEIPVLQGGDKKHPEVINAEFDPLTRTFRVSGVHDRLTLMGQGGAVTIRRGA